MKTFGPPLALAALTLIGLLAALIAGEPAYAASWAALGVPVLVVIIALWKAGRG